MLTHVEPLTLAALEAYDPLAPARDGERRFCCPLPACGDKPIDPAHRSLTVNAGTGLWQCWRCRASGKLRDHWAPRASRRTAVRAFALRPEPAGSPAAAPVDVVGAWARAVPAADTAGAAYLARRGMPLALATAADVRWAPRWYGRPAVLFPIVDPSGALVAITGRHTDAGDPKAHTCGPKALGVFTTPGALMADPLVITEAPLDALALAACGVPALAVCGTSAPRWLAPHAAFRRVWVALDGDAPGETAAEALAATLTALGARCARLRPATKDWTDDLAACGVEALTQQLAALRTGAPIALEAAGEADVDAAEDEDLDVFGGIYRTAIAAEAEAAAAAAAAAARSCRRASPIGARVAAPAHGCRCRRALPAARAVCARGDRPMVAVVNSGGECPYEYFPRWQDGPRARELARSAARHRATRHPRRARGPIAAVAAGGLPVVARRTGGRGV
jgi:hypothetical protein